MAIERKLLASSFFVLILSCAGKASLAQSAPVLTVLVYNLSQATPELLVRTERETQRIFAQAGVQISWTDCPIEKVPSAKSECYEEPTPGQIRLRILKRPPNQYFRDSIFGFAIAPVFASVYYDSAVRLTRISPNADVDLSIVLGCLVTHEIGHLLLGENRHSASGIMKAQWELRQIQMAMMGSMLFLPEERTPLYASARERENRAKAALAAVGSR